MEFKSAGDRELYSIITEQSLNNTAAMQILVEVAVKNGLISIEDFNQKVKKEAEDLKQRLIDRVQEAGR